MGWLFCPLHQDFNFFCFLIQMLRYSMKAILLIKPDTRLVFLIHLQLYRLPGSFHMIHQPTSEPPALQGRFYKNSGKISIQHRHKSNDLIIDTGHIRFRTG